MCMMRNINNCLLVTLGKMNKYSTSKIELFTFLVENKLHCPLCNKNVSYNIILLKDYSAYPVDR